MNGTLDGITSTWGGSALSDGNELHMFAAGFPNAPLSAWLNDSVIVHAVASRPDAPFTPRAVALRPSSRRGGWDSATVHNPVVVRAPDGTFVLYYMGSSCAEPGENCAGTTQDCATAAGRHTFSICRQRIGLATAPSPSGPWTRHNAPILVPRAPPAWDNVFTANPAPYIFSNGSALLVYKSRGLDDLGTMRTGVAFAAHWRGPYERRPGSGPISALGQKCEDAGIYRSARSGRFHMLFHCGCAYRSAVSDDGFEWTTLPGPIGWCNVSLAGGGSAKLKRRERPIWLMGADGEPSHLLTGVVPVRGVRVVRIRSIANACISCVRRAG